MQQVYATIFCWLILLAIAEANKSMFMFPGSNITMLEESAKAEDRIGCRGGDTEDGVQESWLKLSYSSLVYEEMNTKWGSYFCKF